MVDPLLVIKNLHVAFYKNAHLLPILNGIDLEICREEIFALVGESGSGKSVLALTLIKMLAMGGTITAGQIFFDGDDLTHMTQSEMRKLRGKKIGMVFQDPMTSLNPTLTIGKQIDEVLMLHCGLTRQQAKKHTLEMLAFVGISDTAIRYGSYPFQLSGGMRQRVSIAMALACKPSLLIADEPTTALDVTIQAQILELFKKINKETGMTLLLITHDLGVVSSICNRAAVMRSGGIVEIAAVDKILISPDHPYTKSLLEARQGIL